MFSFSVKSKEYRRQYNRVWNHTSSKLGKPFRLVSWVNFIIQSLLSAGSGEIDFDEFLQLMASKQANMTMEDELRNAFNVFDKDGSGYISSDELKQVYSLF